VAGTRVVAFSERLGLAATLDEFAERADPYRDHGHPGPREVALARRHGWPPADGRREGKGLGLYLGLSVKLVAPNGFEPVFQRRRTLREQLQRPGGGATVPLTDARKPRRFTASTICSTETCEGSNATAASFDRRLTSARLTPFSPSRAFLTATGQAPHVMPSTASTTVEAPASAA